MSNIFALAESYGNLIIDVVLFPDNAIAGRGRVWGVVRILEHEY
jgi:hypothetical protein